MTTQTYSVGFGFRNNPLEPLWALRLRMIREAAYFKAERRGFVPGHELDDWLEAEEEIDEASRPLTED